MEKTQRPITSTSVETEIPSYTPAPPSTFATLLIARSDRIRLVSFPQTIIDAVQETILSTWPRGIKNVREYNGSQEFKLRGWPWNCQGDESFLSIRLMRRIFAVLSTYGWVFSLSTDIGKRPEKATAVMFRYQQPVPNPCEWVAISFDGADLLHFIDAPTSLVQALVADLSLVTKSHHPHKLHDVYEFKIYGEPWNSFGTDTMQTWKMAQKLMEILELHGFKVCTSIRHIAANSWGLADTWYCRRQVGWVDGAPVHDGEDKGVSY